MTDHTCQPSENPRHCGVCGRFLKTQTREQIEEEIRRLQERLKEFE